jgi:hypothetical protein
LTLGDGLAGCFGNGLHPSIIACSSLRRELNCYFFSSSVT